MRKALFIGINDYDNISKLSGCNNDAIAMASVLKRHASGTPNFGNKILTSAEDRVTNETITTCIRELFSGDGDVALLYFAGHGQFDTTIDEGVIIPQDYENPKDGIRISDILLWANEANKIHHKIIILDCCQSGSAGDVRVLKGGNSVLGEGITILTACKKEEFALEKSGHGVFTGLMLQALHGGAANILGQITPGSLYSFVDNALGSWAQRPVFKTNVSRFTALRETIPLVSLDILRELPIWFPEQESIYRLDPSFEPTEKNCYSKDNGDVFAKLQKCNRHSLIEPVDEEHMYYAAMKSTGCRLTALGAYYWTLAKEERF